MRRVGQEVWDEFRQIARWPLMHGVETTDSLDHWYHAVTKTRKALMRTPHATRSPKAKQARNTTDESITTPP